MGEIGLVPFQFGRLGPGLIEHGTVQIDPDNVDAAPVEFNGDPTRAAPRVEDAPGAVVDDERDLTVGIFP